MMNASLQKLNVLKEIMADINETKKSKRLIAEWLRKYWTKIMKNQLKLRTVFCF